MGENLIFPIEVMYVGTFCSSKILGILKLHISYWSNGVNSKVTLMVCTQLCVINKLHQMYTKVSSQHYSILFFNKDTIVSTFVFIDVAWFDPYTGSSSGVQ